MNVSWWRKDGLVAASASFSWGVDLSRGDGRGAVTSRRRGMRKRGPSGLPTVVYVYRGKPEYTFDISPVSKVPGTLRSEKLQQPPALRFGVGLVEPWP